mgnify:CR=1 FL=1
MLDAFARVLLRYRIVFLIVLIVDTALMCWLATYVKLSYEGAKILPASDSSYVDYKAFKQKFGEDGTVMVIGLQSDKIFSLPLFNAWYDLSNEIKRIDGIQEVVSISRSYNIFRNDSFGRLDVKPLLPERPVSQAGVDTLKQILFSLPFYEGLLFNRNTNATVMAITFDQDKLNTKSRIAIVRQIKALGDSFELKNDIRLHYSGLPYIRTAVTAKIVSEMKLFTALALIITSLILLTFFRSFKAVLFPMLVVIFGSIWSFGTLVMLGFKITILTSLVTPLIIVIGVPNCILLLNRYQQEYYRHGNKIKALMRMITRVGPTTFFANVTTAIGFFVFYFTHSEVLQEFGITAALNVMLTWFISLIFIPVVFSMLPAPSGRHVKHLERDRKSTRLNSSHRT